MNLNIAGAVVHYNTLSKTLPILKLKNKDINFTVYEGPNLCHWNGGRINRNIILTNQIIEYYNKHGISISLTFSNHNIDLNDDIGNTLLTMLNRSQEKFNIKNKIVLINESLRQYLRNKFDFELIYSITGHQSDIEVTDSLLLYYKDLESKYDFIVPKFEVVFNEKFYETVDTSKYELLINDSCRYGCKYYYDHFKAIAEQNLSLNPLNEFGHEHCTNIEECWLTDFDPNIGYKENSKYNELAGMNYTIEMINKAKSLGYNSFKISGRENTIEQLLYDINFFLSIK